MASTSAEAALSISPELLPDAAKGLVFGEQVQRRRGTGLDKWDSGKWAAIKIGAIQQDGGSIMEQELETMTAIPGIYFHSMAGFGWCSLDSIQVCKI